MKIRNRIIAAWEWFCDVNDRTTDLLANILSALAKRWGSLAAIAALIAFAAFALSPAMSRQNGFLQSGTGATLVTIEQKLRQTVSVKDFGAVGDGVTNDSTAVANAITASGANQAIDFACPGSYKTTLYGTLACGDYYPPISGATGSVPRSLPGKILAIADVKDFGAKGDGVTDDAAAFNNALAAASIILVPYASAGYLVKSGVTVPSGAMLVGESGIETSVFGSLVLNDRGTVRIFADQAAFVGTAVVTLSNRSSVAGITVYGTAAADPFVIGSQTRLRDVGAIGGRYGFNITNQGGIVMLDCQADRNLVGLFSGSGGTDLQAVNCVFSNNTDGVLLNSGAGQIGIESTRFEWNSGSGIKLFDVVGGVTIGSACTFDRNGESAIRLQGVTAQVIVSNGVRFSRNGATTANAALKTHLSLEGTGSKIRIGRAHWVSGHINDDGSGIITPEYAVSVTGTYTDTLLDDQPATQNTGVYYDATTRAAVQRGVALTAQTANLAATNVAVSALAGTYLVCVNARTTTSGTGTTANVNIIWTDEGGVKTDAVGTWALNSVTVTGQINKCEYIHAAAATNIQVSVTAGTYGTSAYALDATTERLN